MVDRVIDLLAVIVGAISVNQGYEIGFVLLIGGLVFLVFGQRIQRMLLGYRGRSMIGKVTNVTVDDDALHAANELATMSIPWSSLTELRSDAKVTILLRDRLLVFYMPANAFPSATERSGFEAFARTRIGR